MQDKNLKNLEDESIAIIRETFANAERPLILYSIGKDSSVMMHLFKKAFYPVKVPIKFLHIDTGWKFSEMINFRDKIFKSSTINGIVYKNLEGERMGINPFEHENYTDIMKTAALKKYLMNNYHDIVYGGARRDEEASRSKERIVSHRDKNNSWKPLNQNVEPWNIFNTTKLKKESFRVFPISNWTEVNIWEYIESQNIAVVPLYFAKKRKVVVSKKGIFLYDDNRFQLERYDEIKTLNVRFRTLGCFPLTAGIISNARTVKGILEELKKTKLSERSGRLIDFDKQGSMEIKKKEGYF